MSREIFNTEYSDGDDGLVTIQASMTHEEVTLAEIGDGYHVTVTVTYADFDRIIEAYQKHKREMESNG